VRMNQNLAVLPDFVRCGERFRLHHCSRFRYFWKGFGDKLETIEGHVQTQQV
jgi:hypothetical protein